MSSCALEAVISLTSDIYGIVLTCQPLFTFFKGKAIIDFDFLETFFLPYYILSGSVVYLSVQKLGGQLFLKHVKFTMKINWLKENIINNGNVYEDSDHLEGNMA